MCGKDLGEETVENTGRNGRDSGRERERVGQGACVVRWITQEQMAGIEGFPAVIPYGGAP